jgi:hypothetical protein
VQVQVPRRFRRRSPLAQLPASSTLLMLAILPKTCHRTFVLDFVLINVTGAELFRNFYAIKVIKTFSFEKNVTFPHLAVLHENF